ncbi:hypothetical protein MAIT1_05387 [Magnetofaba australis IT-1]|uniref:ATPase AAA-type core domain-containing protein n=1 Tax=Magnetofaba australis IT-1 TaxID=1434232 RepID=A0A1Y2K2M4_9PROT|nr:hypothetical protein MAIT1_05387 [Magnetofaba australis IT-1]
MRDIPSIRMADGVETPVLYASAGVRRILALAYMLVWAWQEHRIAADLRGEQQSDRIVFLIDEIEAHLHPKWQRRIVQALRHVVEKLSPQARTQLIAATHSPLIMASIEPQFHEKTDRWFDLDLVDGKPQLRRMAFVKHGDAEGWLTSEAFDQKSSRAPEYEALMAEASWLVDERNPDVDASQIQEMSQRLINALDPKDAFLMRWRYIAQKKGWVTGAEGASRSAEGEPQ